MFEKELEGRRLAFKSLVGSHNYNLNDELSDKDYKLFVYPHFEDLYNNTYFSLPSQVTPELDFDVHDVRKITRMWWKSNINFLEVLFSIDIEYAYGDALIADLISMRDRIARMNVPYLFHACKGMYHTKMAYLNKGTKGTMPLVKKFGYDTKQALHSYRTLDFVERFMYTDFNDFEKAIKYVGKERDEMLAFKQGAYTEDEFRKIVEEKYKKVLTYQEVYDKIPTDEDTYKIVCAYVKELTKKHLFSS